MTKNAKLKELNPVKKKFVIDENTLIVDIAERFPAIGEYLTGEYGFHCVGCPLMYADSLGEGAMVHGLDEDEIKKLIAEVNKMVPD
jgi:hybrid cluster-associated redox disulfide protein